MITTDEQDLYQMGKLLHDLAYYIAWWQYAKAAEAIEARFSIVAKHIWIDTDKREVTVNGNFVPGLDYMWMSQYIRIELVNLAPMHNWLRSQQPEKPQLAIVKADESSLETVKRLNEQLDQMQTTVSGLLALWGN